MLGPSPCPAFTGHVAAVDLFLASIYTPGLYGFSLDHSIPFIVISGPDPGSGRLTSGFTPPSLCVILPLEVFRCFGDLSESDHVGDDEVKLLGCKLLQILVLIFFLRGCGW